MIVLIQRLGSDISARKLLDELCVCACVWRLTGMNTGFLAPKSLYPSDVIYLEPYTDLRIL